MKKDKFRFLVLALVLFVCAISVSAREIKSVDNTHQISIKKVECQQSTSQLFQPTQVAQLKYATPFKTPNLARTNHGSLPGFAFAMPSPFLAFQLDGFDGGPTNLPPVDAGCYFACRLIGFDVRTCLNLCVMN